jgi:hypothetical protein
MKELACKRCEKTKNDIGITGLCETCSKKFFSDKGAGAAALSKLFGIGSNRLLKYEKSGELISTRNEYGSRVYHRNDVEKLLQLRSIRSVRRYKSK